MLRPTHLIGLFGLLLAAGCSSSSSGGGTTDAGTSQDSANVDSCAPIPGSICGQPCNGSGNQFGVGAFCNNLTDCTQLPKAHLCASLGNPNAHFCTMRCSLPLEAGADDAGGDAGLPFTTDCGSGAECTCDTSGANCGCTPSMCLTGGGGG
jgi:hypothetical protein